MSPGRQHLSNPALHFTYFPLLQLSFFKKKNNELLVPWETVLFSLKSLRFMRLSRGKRRDSRENKTVSLGISNKCILVSHTDHLTGKCAISLASKGWSSYQSTSPEAGQSLER